jgi:hypothetical protein
MDQVEFYAQDSRPISGQANAFGAETLPWKSWKIPESFGIAIRL